MRRAQEEKNKPFRGFVTNSAKMRGRWLRYRAHNGGTFGQARAAVVVEVAKAVRPKLYAQAVRGGPARRVTAPVTAHNKTESLPMAQNSATKKARPAKDKPETGETRKPQTFERYGTNPEVDLESIDSMERAEGFLSCWP
ncbi:hypothetical protein ElyMa_005034600 [Elysia marginata]|uniref:AP2/ERF domain-containing protein n=1 Tax=Elysia marginata TaxID=1093978 RepID=A0AAV4JCK3_9GAST|nr:hypothetical protein ElyMa_005034600 [Elysia marginata]